MKKNSVYNRNEISTVFLSRPSKIAIFIIFPLNTEETFQSLKMLIWSLCQELIINYVNVRDNYFENIKELVIVKKRLSTREITNLFSVQPIVFLLEKSFF
ncbi:hypothetical protein BpHYR1_049511 [Brachionus plicatilis]|uniref:Uncharacterized protein n=1 Tax=Brachionus plicatilis TaxID=10195 RepID=A0A3M7PY89_BRAPC|nr:hypothetical protein BpHYR1_049511 [Brachionus plicatilis]